MREFARLSDVHDPRYAVLRQLARAFDHWTAEEQVLLAEGEYTQSQGAHGYAYLVMRAYTVESENPKPKGLS